MDKAQPTNTATNPTPTLLIISESPTARSAILEQVLAKGWAAMESVNQRQAVNLFSSFAPELVLLDARSGQAAALETCARIRDLPAGKSVPVILITEQLEADEVTTAFAAGVSDIAESPLNWPLLLQRIPRYLTAASALQQQQTHTPQSTQSNRLIGMGHWEWNVSTGALSCSSHIRQILPDLAAAATLDDYLSYIPELNRSDIREAFYLAAARKQRLTAEHLLETPENGQRTMLLRGHVRSNKSNASTIVNGTLHDVTDRRKNVQTSRQIETRDLLTGLANREHFESTLDDAISQAEFKQRKLAVLFIDLDDFQRINDSLGHSVGDKLLGSIGNTFSSLIRTGEPVGGRTSLQQISRFDGDEFAILLPDIMDSEAPGKVAARILQELNDPASNLRGPLRVSASIGIGIYPRDASDGAGIIEQAETAMHLAKANGKNSYRYFKAEAGQTTKVQYSFESRLQQAISKEEFTLQYQPQIELEDGSINGVEALLRWQPETLGDVSPSRFIPAAEKQGLMDQIDRWVLNRACSDLRHWMQQGCAPVSISVNIGRSLFFSRNLANSVNDALEKAELLPHQLIIELDESIPMSDSQRALMQINTLHEIGCGLAIDNYGTGLSSLEVLKRFNLSQLKMNRHLTRDISSASESRPLAAAVVQLGHNLGMQVIAQGVESRRQLEAIQASGCDGAQGFFISKPASADKVMQTLQARSEPRNRVVGIRS